MTIREITAPESREYCKQLIYDVMADGSGSTATSLCRPDGGTTDVDVRARRVTIQGRSYLQGLARDITAARTAERALREKDTRLRLVVQQTPAILWTTDRDLCFTSSEGSGLGALGLRPGGVVGKSLYEFFQTDDPDFLAIAVHRQALNGVSASYETVWDGRVFESHTEPLRDENGEIIGTVGIALDISERKRAEQQLKESEQKLRALALRLQKVRDDESASLAREFHDEIGQSLSALKMDIGWSLRRVAELDRAQRCMPIISRLESMAADVDATIKRVRAISTELRPVILDHAGLLRALEWQAGVFQERTGITCDFIIETSEDLHLDGDRSTTLFRIFQEILTNVGLHAHARHVAIKLDRENGSLVLDVADDGLGIKQSDLCGAQALGILGMRERARVFDGEVSIRRRNGRGTRVVVRIPLSENA